MGLKLFVLWTFYTSFSTGIGRENSASHHITWVRTQTGVQKCQQICNAVQFNLGEKATSIDEIHSKDHFCAICALVRGTSEDVVLVLLQLVIEMGIHILQQKTYGRLIQSLVSFLSYNQV